ncbi:MAG: hypothetical protein J7513_09210 [Solirubrobacteraceae bacterium]|nr:hypothetical protein [Solirubrobacteraceae bacterium]
MRWILLSVLALSVVAPAARGAESLGFSDAGVTPAAVAAPGNATVAFVVTAPAGGNTTTFTVRPPALGRVGNNVGHPKGWRRAEDGTGSPGVPSLNVKGARLDGPGTLIEGARTMEAYSRAGCVRDGVGTWGSTMWFRLDLPAGQTTRVLVDVTLPRGLAGRSPILELTPTAWQPAVPPVNDLAFPIGAKGAGLQVPVPRSSGVSDVVTLERLPGKHGIQQLSGVVFPARAGQRVEVVGRSARKASRVWAYFALDNILRNTITDQRVLAEATTDANGRWHANAKLAGRTTFVARTTKGLKGQSTRGASCPLTLG